jgi:AcrR family transcriptional regulator
VSSPATADSEPLPLAGTVEWWRVRYAQGQRRRPRDDGLSIDRITSAALAITDAEGLEALTMRRLAGELGAGVASLYRHVATRDELLVEMMDHVLGEICPPPPSLTSWREGAEWMAREFRRVLTQHRDVPSLLSRDRLAGPNAMRGREMSLRGLLDQGFPAFEAVKVYGILVSWVLGHTMLSSSVAAHEATGDGPRANLYAELDVDLFPTVQLLARVGDPAAADLVFEAGLGTILDGIEARLPS